MVYFNMFCTFTYLLTRSVGRNPSNGKDHAYKHMSGTTFGFMNSQDAVQERWLLSMRRHIVKDARGAWRLLRSVCIAHRLVKRVLCRYRWLHMVPVSVCNSIMYVKKPCRMTAISSTCGNDILNQCFGVQDCLCRLSVSYNLPYMDYIIYACMIWLDP